MAKSISSQPGANRFRSVSVIILILICISLFLSYSRFLAQKTDEVARDIVVTEIRQALAMMLYDYALKGRLAQLQKFDRENPFTLMAAYRPLPLNYKGALVRVSPELPAGWYFDLIARRALWVAHDGQREYYQLRFEFNDKNQNEQFDSLTEEVGGLQLKKASG
jgi:hypothetical protein